MKEIGKLIVTVLFLQFNHFSWHQNHTGWEEQCRTFIFFGACLRSQRSICISFGKGDCVLSGKVLLIVTAKVFIRKLYQLQQIRVIATSSGVSPRPPPAGVLRASSAQGSGQGDTAGEQGWGRWKHCSQRWGLKTQLWRSLGESQALLAPFAEQRNQFGCYSILNDPSLPWTLGCKTCYLYYETVKFLGWKETECFKQTLLSLRLSY